MTKDPSQEEQRKQYADAMDDKAVTSISVWNALNMHDLARYAGFCYRKRGVFYADLL
jgi:lysozyme family protein